MLNKPATANSQAAAPAIPLRAAQLTAADFFIIGARASASVLQRVNTFSRAVAALPISVVLGTFTAATLPLAALAADYPAPPEAVIRDLSLSPEAPSFGKPMPLQLYADIPSSAGKGLTEVLLSVWREAPQVLEAAAEVEAAGYEVQGAKTGYYPFLQVDASQGDNAGSSTTMSIIQPLWDGGLTRAQIAESRALEDRAGAELGVVQISNGLDAADAYLQLALAEETSAQWQTYIAELNDLTQLVQRRADQGVSPRNDIELARVRVQQAKAGAAGSRGLQQAARSRLAVFVDYPLVSAPWPTARSVVSAAEVEQLFKYGVPDKHPRRLRAVHEMRAQQARGRATRAAIWPSISLQHVRQLDQQDGDFTPDSATVVALQFQSNEGLRGFRAGQAQASRVKASMQAVQNADREIADSIQSAISERESARQQFEAYASAAQSSKMLVESNLRRFKVGRKSWLEVLNARRESHEAGLRALEQKREFWLANSKLTLQAILWRTASSPAQAGAPISRSYDLAPVTESPAITRQNNRQNNMSMPNRRAVINNHSGQNASSVRNSPPNRGYVPNTSSVRNNLPNTGYVPNTGSVRNNPPNTGHVPNTSSVGNANNVPRPNSFSVKNNNNAQNASSVNNSQQNTNIEKNVSSVPHTPFRYKKPYVTKRH